jgi:hypothetical protein
MNPDLSDYILIGTLLCELMLRVLPVKSNYSILVIVRNAFDWLHKVLPNNTK